jgi:hypothetical protein
MAGVRTHDRPLHISSTEIFSKDKQLFPLLRPGTDFMILQMFSPNNLAKKLAFFAQTTGSFF